MKNTNYKSPVENFGNSEKVRNKFFKIEGIKEAVKYKLPVSKTIFIFDFAKQEKEIESFIKDRKYVSVRSDSKNGSDFCPHDLKCPGSKAKEFIRELISHGYAVIVQEYIPWEKDIASGNILILEKHILMELMGEGPLIWLNRDGAIAERIKFKKDDLKEVGHFGKRLIQKKDLLKILRMVKDVPIYKIIEFTLRPEGLYFWQIRDDQTAKEIEDKNLLGLNFNRFKKIKSIREIQKYGLPMSETIFIFDFDRQEKEIDDFIRNRDYVAIRTDKRNGLDFYPHNLRCSKNKAKKLIKKLNLKGYAIILHEQEHIPFGKAEHQISGNILILKKHYLIELMEGEPLYLLNRDGKIDEFIEIEKNTLKEVAHFGKRVIKKSDLNKILRLIRRLPDFKIVEFTLRKDGLIFWQMIDDKNAKMLES